MGTPLEDLMTLPIKERNAFLGLFAGARLTAQVAKDGDTGREYPPKWGKAECEWVDDWRHFYGRKLPELGLAGLHETEPRPALGMAPGSTCWEAVISITDRGRQAREAYWNRLPA